MATCSAAGKPTTNNAARPVWGTKQYILAAIGVTLAVSTVAIVTSVILSPARVSFSVTAASFAQVQGPMLVLNFTLHAANPSRRAAVEYRSVMARLGLYSPSHATTAWVQTEVHHAMPLLQPPATSRSLRVSAFFDVREFGGSGTRAPPMTVVVLAQVRFKVGVAYSRPYGVEVSCQPVDFFTTDAAATKTRCAA
uniref:Uncharacterized protein n=1 Tax=Avena sativa TaxID=4498 RepID=A0ACD5ZJ12_AVESA